MNSIHDGRMKQMVSGNFKSVSVEMSQTPKLWVLLLCSSIPQCLHHHSTAENAFTTCSHLQYYIFIYLELNRSPTLHHLYSVLQYIQCGNLDFELQIIISFISIKGLERKMLNVIDTANLKHPSQKVFSTQVTLLIKKKYRTGHCCIIHQNKHMYHAILCFDCKIFLQKYNSV